MAAYTITDTAINLVVDGQSFTVPRHGVNGAKLIEGIRAGLSDRELIELADPTTYINAAGGGVVVVKGGVVKFNGEDMPECLVNRLMDLVSNNLPVQHLVNFYAKLDKNPSRRAVQELYTFLEHKNIPITPEGNLLMYKAITNNWMDKHTCTVLNKPGCKPAMKRHDVCDDADIGCSKGYHAGSLKYVTEFACGYGDENGDRIVLVEVDPGNVVSIPKDCDCQKVRMWTYTVLQEYKGPLPSGGIRDTSNPYMEDLEGDLDDPECPECGSFLDDEGNCQNEDCTECPDHELIITQAELNEALAKAREEGRNS
jgi:hypothetical protein